MQLLSPAFLEQSDGYITCKIPKHREPEFGFLFSDIADIHTIYEGLHSRPDVRILDGLPSDNKYLVSLAQDTVDKNGIPTQELAEIGLERRRRQSLYPKRLEYQRYDISIKTADKRSQLRREWEANTYSLTTGEAEIKREIEKDLPEAARINPSSFRVSSVCVTSRASYMIEHHLEDEGAIIVYEVCNDACFFTSPHADMILGYRKETELEAKQVKLLGSVNQSEENINRLVDKSIEKLRDCLWQLEFKELVADSSLSKVADANRHVANHYESTAKSHDMTGLEWALLQNISAVRFADPTVISNLSKMTSALPKPALLLPSNKPKNYGVFFPAI